LATNQGVVGSNPASRTITEKGQRHKRWPFFHCAAAWCRDSQNTLYPSRKTVGTVLRPNAGEAGESHTLQKLN
jgi:hypothetical protein